MSRVALVTGGTRGIGAAIAIALKNAGYKVAANFAGNEEKAKAFEAETGIPVYKWDVSSYAACAEGIAKVEADLGPVDILVNNAGITRDAMFHKMTPEQWGEVIGTNLTGLFNMTHPLWSGMRDRSFGRVINISSINGQKGQMGQANYSAAKAGDLGFTKALAQEGHYRQRDLPRLYRHGNGARHSGKGAERAYHSADPGWPSWRTGGNRALRGVPCFGRCRLHHRLDDLGQWWPVLRLILSGSQ